MGFIQKKNSVKVDILAIGAHPDDIELSCAGTLLKHIEQGHVVGLVDLTKGELGSRGSAAIRMKEAEAARKMMNAAVRENVGLKDGFFDLEKSVMKLIPYIRRFQPEIVLANAISDRHPDHGRAAELIRRACFLAGLIKIKTTWKNEKKAQAPWRPKQVFHYIQDRYIEPDFVVDISPYMERKIEIVKAYGSQFFNPKLKKYNKEVQTAISGKDFLDNLYAKANIYGRNISVPYAEGFTIDRTLGVDSLFDIR